MNPIFFGIKRAYHRSLRISHSTLRPFGITPARLDMLKCIERLEDGFQYQIVDALGVSAATVSRMLKSLIEMGLVDKGPFDEWKTVRVVWLTEKGKKLLAQVLEAVDGSGIADLTQQVASSWSHSKRRVTMHIERFNRHLRWVRFALGDTSIRFDETSCTEIYPFDEKLLRRPVALLNDKERRRAELFGLAEVT